jgi:sugar diacid utilization regulator
MNPITYEVLMTCRPFFHGDILAGWNGRKNQCQQLILNDKPHEENSLVIIKHPDVTMDQLEIYLLNHHTTGILILSDQSCDLPSSIIEMASTIQKPILLLKNVTGEDLQKRMTEIFYLNDLNLISVMKNDLTAYWLQLFNQHGIDPVIRRFNLFLGQEVYFFTPKRKFIPLLSNKYSAKDFRKVEKIESNFEYDAPFSIVDYEIAKFYSFEITDPSQKLMGYLLFEHIITAKDLPFQLLESLVPSIITWYKQKEVTANVHNMYSDQFLFDILHNNIDMESELIELGRLRDMEFTPNAFVFSMNLNSDQTITKEMVMNIQQLMIENESEKANLFSTYLNHRMVVIVCPAVGTEKLVKKDWNTWINKVRNEMTSQYPDIKTTIGVGRSYYSILDIYKSFLESKIALQQMEIYRIGADGIIHYEDLGFVRLLSYLHNDLLREFSHQYLDEIEKYDRENESDLFHTLTVFLAQSGDISRTAEHLFIHQNTLRQRIKKIESILGMELNNYSTLVNLMLSVQIVQDQYNY